MQARFSTSKACAHCRVDARRLAVAHPKLGPAVATMLDIPALEHVVVEVLDSFGAPGDHQLQSIQVSACDACGVPVLTRGTSRAFDVRPLTCKLCQFAIAQRSACVTLVSPLRVQDLTLAAARERLKLPPFAAAVCDVLRACADAVQSLQSLPLEQVACCNITSCGSDDMHFSCLPYMQLMLPWTIMGAWATIVHWHRSPSE